MATIPDFAENHASVGLLDLEPELGAWIAAADRPVAARATRLLTVDLRSGAFDPGTVFELGHGGFGALVVSGLITRELSLGTQPSTRLIGPGDVFLDERTTNGPLNPACAWIAATPTQLAILDDRLLLAVRRWPRLLRGVCARLERGHEATFLQMAISHQPRVEERIFALFRVLAARWGQMSAEGAVVPMALTHQAIGRLVGARRPTVTLALQALAGDGRLRRAANDRWVLPGEGGQQADNAQPASVSMLAAPGSLDSERGA